ncbi:MAG: hypothetical protein ACRC2O_04755, partial [Chitinophagaceae bacterium]
MSTFNNWKAIFALIFLIGCSPGKKIIQTAAETPVLVSENPVIMPEKKEISFLEKLLISEKNAFANLFQNPDSFNLQIIYTQIDRDKDKIPRFTD